MREQAKAQPTATLPLACGGAVAVILGASQALAQGTLPPTPPATAPPPCAAAPFRAFDFWVGDWVVHTADGTLAGRNRIRLRERDCVLLEQWTGASGSTGMSMNFYEPVSQRWRQVWHSASGALIDIAGAFDGEAMVLTGTIEYVANATKQPFRGTWKPLEDGRVRQFFEQSDDGGETWQPWFEGFYSRDDGAVQSESP